MFSEPTVSADETAKLIFDDAGPNAGFLLSTKVASILGRSGLPESELKKVWKEAKAEKSPVDKMNVAEFVAACALVTARGGQSLGILKPENTQPRAQVTPGSQIQAVAPSTPTEKTFASDSTSASEV
jgi:hypothetical protein